MAPPSQVKTASVIDQKSITKIDQGPDQNGIKKAAIKKKRPAAKSKPRDRSPTSCLSDGRPIDMVLCYKPMEASVKKRVQYAKYRRNFENQLRAQGLELEYESKHLSRDGKTAYVKIHAPFDVLARQAELRRLRKPTHPYDIPRTEKRENIFTKCTKKLFHDPFRLQPNLEYPYKDQFTAPFRRKNQNDFIGVDERETFFTPAERAYLTWDTVKMATVEVKRKRGFVERPIVDMGNVVLDPHAKFGKLFRRPSEMPQMISVDEREKQNRPTMLRVGIDYLLQMNVYESMYALHDSDLDSQHFEQLQKKPVTRWPLRMYLYESWIRPSQIFRHQPLDAIKDYYGERVAFYFAWLGFYTKMLIIPAIVGCLVLIYGGTGMGDNSVSKQICHNETIGQMIICRNCPQAACEYRYMKHFCTMAQVTEVFDNEITVVFSLFIAIWAVVFLEYWKRYRAELMARWHIDDNDDEENGIEEEQVRPEYEMHAADRRRNTITGQFEPYVPLKDRFKRFMASFVTILFLILIIVGFIASIMIYRVVGPGLWMGYLGEDVDHEILTSVTGAVINGVFIGIMSKIYRYAAVYLTQAEYPRRDSEYEKSYTYKVVIFESVNYYSALFYLGFVNGQFPPSPKDQHTYQERCPITGCLLDLVIQLAIVYGGKQFVDSALDIGVPIIIACWRKVVHATRSVITKNQGKTVRWESDHDLSPGSKILLFSDYLKLFIQYGFVTMMVPAFPLAPMFALLNNIISIRLDAYKVLVLNRRSIPLPLKQGVNWADLVRMLGKMAIITNALLIALGTDFIPRTVFMVEYSKDGTLQDFLDFRLSVFNTSDWVYEGQPAPWMKEWHNQTVDQCYYRGFMQSPFEEDPHGLPAYSRRKEFWHVLIARLAFIVVFEHFIFLLQWLTEFLIPEVPTQIRMRRQREEYLERKRFMKDESKKTHATANGEAANVQH